MGFEFAEVNSSVRLNIRKLETFIQKLRLIPFGEGQAQVLFFLIANDADVKRAALMSVHGTSEIATIIDGITVYFHNHVPGVKSRLLSAAALFHRAYQNSLTVLGAKKLTQLGSEIFNHQSAARRGVHYHNRDGHINIRH